MNHFSNINFLRHVCARTRGRRNEVNVRDVCRLLSIDPVSSLFKHHHTHKKSPVCVLCTHGTGSIVQCTSMYNLPVPLPSHVYLVLASLRKAEAYYAPSPPKQKGRHFSSFSDIVTPK